MGLVFQGSRPIWAAYPAVALGAQRWVERWHPFRMRGSDVGNDKGCRAGTLDVFPGNHGNGNGLVMLASDTVLFRRILQLSEKSCQGPLRRAAFGSQGRTSWARRCGELMSRRHPAAPEGEEGGAFLLPQRGAQSRIISER